MMFEKKPRFRIVLDEYGRFIVEELRPTSWVFGMKHYGYVFRSAHHTQEQAEGVIERLARAGTVVAEYDYPPLTRRADRVS